MKNARYSSTKSGWFDTFTFTDWFSNVFLPVAKRLVGKVLLLGDNLSSHISIEVINLCRENNIAFVCLPANSTDKMQPLDVGLFGPMKAHWRKQLRAYADRDPTSNLLQKTEFPRMLKELLESLNCEQLLPKAFERCGLIPINPEKVLELIPSVVRTTEAARHLDAALLKRLEVRRFGELSKKRPRGKKVPAGQSYTDREEDEESDEEEDKEETDEEETDEEETGEEEVEENEVEENEGNETQGNEAELFEDEVEAVLQGAEELPTVNAGTYVVAVYEQQWFLAEVSRDQSQVKRGYTKLEYLVIKGTNAFSYPSKPDLHITLDEDIIIKNVSPEPVNSRGCLGLNKKDLGKVLTLMVVFISSSFSTYLVKFSPFRILMNKIFELILIHFTDFLNRSSFVL
jgi:hypothetical protein